LLPRSSFGHAEQSIGKNTAAGNLGLIPPNVIIEKHFEMLTVDGVRMQFQNTPGTEVPADMNTWQTRAWRSTRCIVSGLRVQSLI
jgi:alkyl sulfatase BDS1-like metallo-beta-lactamase superfamily hydrolase